MSQRQWIVIVGVWVMIFLFVGLPSSWEKIAAILTGLLIVFLAYRIRFKENSFSGTPPFTDTTSASPVSEKPSQPETKGHPNL